MKNNIRDNLRNIIDACDDLAGYLEDILFNKNISTDDPEIHNRINNLIQNLEVLGYDYKRK